MKKIRVAITTTHRVADFRPSVIRALDEYTTNNNIPSRIAALRRLLDNPLETRADIVKAQKEAKRLKHKTIEHQVASMLGVPITKERQLRWNLK